LCEGTKIKEARLHDLRHFAGSQLVAAGVDIRTVSARLGLTTRMPRHVRA
jgi:site-specific recombinase XerD